MDTLSLLALGLGAAWASGINLYATILVLGGLGASGVVGLPGDLTVLEHPAVLVVAGALYVVEFVADKIPGVDSLWDALHTVIRVPAGALLAAGVAREWGAEYEVVAALLAGGALAAASHATKASGRVAINASPEPFSNWAVSLFEDVLVIGSIILALFMPALFLTLLGGFVLLAIWLLPKLWRALRRLFGSFGERRGGDDEAAARTGLDLDFGSLPERNDGPLPPPKGP